MLSADQERASDLGPRLLSAEFSHSVVSPQLIETHISWVLLTGEFAYKIKKPVRFDFLDYSTLELRERQCRRELDAGKRFAPELYLDVVSIRRTRDGLSVDCDEGPIIEYAVRMRQFDQAWLLENQLQSGLVANREMDALAEQLAQYHNSAEQIKLPPDAAVASSVQPAAENVEFLLAHLTDSAQRPAIQALMEWSNSQVSKLGTWFVDRAAAGAIRQCHGDLHLNNVLRRDGKYTAFDAIEFSDRLSQIDTMNEIAFVMMELREHGYPAHSRRLINHYVETMDDYAGLVGLPFYLVYRAMVRAKVDVIRRGQKQGTPAQALSPAGWRYVEYAQHIVDRPAPALWIMHGLSGSGKSTVALRLVEECGLFRVRSDVIRKKLMGLQPLQKTPGELVAKTYSREITDRVYTHLSARCDQVLMSGYGVVADATFLKRAERNLFSALAKRLNVPLRIVECAAPPQELEHRLAARGPDPSDATLDVLRKQIATAEPLTDEERSRIANDAMLCLKT